MSVSSFDNLPVEVLLKICRYLDIPDILHIRRVSRYLNTASHCKAIWAHAYLTANTVRPPGPFSSHSAVDLENTLIRSFSIDQILRHGTNTTRAQKLREIPLTPHAVGFRLVFGRFLLIARYDEIRCHDLDSFDINPIGRIIYRPTAGSIRQLHTDSATDTGGIPFACVVVQESVETESRSQFSVFLLNVTERSEVVLDLLYKFNEDFYSFSIELGPRVIIIFGFLASSHDILVVLDVHSRTLFLLPSFYAEWEIRETQNWWSLHPHAISTSTHIIITRTAMDDSATLFEAFSLPLLKSQGPPTPLKCSHRGVISGIGAPLDLLHAMRISSTQEHILTLRVISLGPSHRWKRYHSQCGSLRFQNPRDGDVGALTFQPFDASDSNDRFTLIHSPWNGTRRMIYAHRGYTSSECISDYNVVEYAVLSNGNEIKTREYSAALRFPRGYFLEDYDPYSGRMCFMPHVRKRKDSKIEIWDLQHSPMEDKPAMDTWKGRLKLAKTKICTALSKVYRHS